MKLSRKITILLLIILLTLAIAVATVSAAEISGPDNAIAATDMQGEAGTLGGPISANIHRLISPWAIDSGRGTSRF